MDNQYENKPKVISDKDKEQANSRQNGGTSERMSQREAAAGLNLAGNNTMSGRGQPMPTMSEREEAAGLNLAGNDTLSGRQSQEERTSLDRQKATRERRAEEKRVKDLRKEALNQVRSQSVTSTKDIRKVKAADEGELLSMLGRQSQEGNIYDVETGNYDPTFNKEGTDETILNDGIDQLGADDDSGDSRTVTICVNGSPEEVKFLTA